jgi:hypothetical protein
MSTPTLWYYHKEDRGFGPVEEGDIAGLFARNEVAADTLVRRDGLSNWTEARSTELSGFLFQVPPLRCPFRSSRYHDKSTARYFGCSSPSRRYSTFLSSAFRYLWF